MCVKCWNGEVRLHIAAAASMNGGKSHPDVVVADTVLLPPNATDDDDDDVTPATLPTTFDDVDAKAAGAVP